MQMDTSVADNANGNASIYNDMLVSKVVNILGKNGGVIYGDYIKHVLVNQPYERIDAFMTLQEFPEFLRECRAAYLTMTSEWIEGNLCSLLDISLDPQYWKMMASCYPVPIDMSDIIQQCEKVKPVKLSINTTSFATTDPLFDTFAFECDALYLGRTGLYASEQVVADHSVLRRHNATMRVIEGIKNKKTRMVVCSNTRDVAARGKWLLDNGWIIYDSVLTSVEQDNCVCILCCDMCPGVHFKMQCCNAHFHPKCMKNSIGHGFTKQCHMCRRNLFFDSVHHALMGMDDATTADTYSQL